MIRLLIYRHGKAAAREGTQEDRERELAPRGRRQAEEVGSYLAARRLFPDLVLASDSTRTRETVESTIGKWGRNTKVRHLSQLYDGDWRDYVAAVAGHGAGAKCIMVVGHNPAVEEWIERIAGNHITIKTGCLVVADVEVAKAGDVSQDSPMKMSDIYTPAAE